MTIEKAVSLFANHLTHWGMWHLTGQLEHRRLFDAKDIWLSGDIVLERENVGPHLTINFTFQNTPFRIELTGFTPEGPKSKTRKGMMRIEVAGIPVLLVTMEKRASCWSCSELFVLCPNDAEMVWRDQLTIIGKQIEACLQWRFSTEARMYPVEHWQPNHQPAA